MNDSRDKNLKNRTTTNNPIISNEEPKLTSVSKRHNSSTNKEDIYELENDSEIEIEPFNIENEIGVNNFNKDGY